MRTSRLTEGEATGQCRHVSYLPSAHPRSFSRLWPTSYRKPKDATVTGSRRLRTNMTQNPFRPRPPGPPGAPARGAPAPLLQDSAPCALVRTAAIRILVCVYAGCKLFNRFIAMQLCMAVSTVKARDVYGAIACCRHTYGTINATRQARGHPCYRRTRHACGPPQDTAGSLSPGNGACY